MKNKLIIIILVAFVIGVLFITSHAYVVLPLLVALKVLTFLIIAGLTAYFIGRFRARRNP
jgi:hypothetical protein